MVEYKKWEIDKSKLKSYKDDGWVEDFFTLSPNQELGIIVYNIDEWRMMSYAGLVAICSNPTNPKIELNSDTTWIWFDNDKTFYYMEKSGCIACRKPAFDPKSSKGDFPFLIINMKNKSFGFLEFDGSSIYYGLEEVEKNRIRIFEVYPEELKRLNRPTRQGEEICLTNLTWYDLRQFDDALKLYQL